MAHSWPASGTLCENIQPVQGKADGQRRRLEYRLGQAVKNFDFHAKGFGPHSMLEQRARFCQSSEAYPKT